MIAIRDAYGKRLQQLGAERPDVVVLDADVGSSTKSIYFGKSYPDRYFNFGIAEFNMITAAAGMAANGWIPFANTFAIFLVTRCTDAIHSIICHDRLNVKLCGAYAGVSDALDGASHHCLFDLAVMRSMPGMLILSPCDANETEKCVEAAAAYPGPVYLRLSRAELPVLTAKDTPFEVGRGILLRDGADVTLVATGSAVCRAMDAAEILQTMGVSAQVVDMHTIQPLDCELLKACTQKTRAVVTVEEHSITGGLGTAVVEALANFQTALKIIKIGIDPPTVSGSYQQLIQLYRLDGPSIAEKVFAFLRH